MLGTTSHWPAHILVATRMRKTRLSRFLQLSFDVAILRSVWRCVAMLWYPRIKWCFVVDVMVWWCFSRRVWALVLRLVFWLDLWWVVW
jgi:hypothetical protein